MAPMWDRIDPLAEKYYGISPYAYCGGDPVNRGDYDGRLIEFAENSSIEFIQQFFAAYQTLAEANAADEINKAFFNPSYTIVVSELSNDDWRGSKYSPRTNTLHWAPEQGLETDNGYILSPMEILSHEFDHAVQQNDNPTQARNDTKQSDTDYDNLEERRVITGSEQNVAKKLGKTNSVSVTRTNHNSGHLVYVDGPTSSTKQCDILPDLGFEIIVTHKK